MLNRAAASSLTIEVPDPALVVLVGAAGAGKSTFAARHFEAAEIISSDALRAVLTGDEADQRATRLAFAILHREVSRRLATGRTVVVDATNVESHARRTLVGRAAAAGVPAIAIVLALPADVVDLRNRTRPGRVVDPEIVDRHLTRLAAAVDRGAFATEGFAAVHLLRSVSDVEDAVIERRQPMRESIGG